MKQLKGLAILVLGLWMAPVPAQEMALDAARLLNAAEIAQLIAYPDGARDGEMTIIRCGTLVTSRGRTEPGIYSNREEAALFRPFEDEVRKVFHRLRIQPARVGGRDVGAWVNFSVVFDNLQGAKQVRIVPNLQYDTKRYGDAYIDPQRIDKLGFPKTCTRRPPVWTLTKVAANGVALSASVVLGKTSQACESSLLNLLMRSDYVPAQHDGKAVEGTYIEAWYTSS